MAQAESTSSEETKVAPISDDIVSASTEESPGRMRRFGRTVWRVIRMLLILAIVAGIGVAIYFGWPIVNERYIQPIASNSAGLQTAAGRMDGAEAQIADLEERVAALSAADAGVPERLTAIDEAIAELTANQSSTDSRLDSVDRQIAGHTERLDSLDTIQADLAAGIEGASAEASRQVEVLRSMELLSRARLFLYQANYGLARADVQVARTVLADVQATYPDWQPDVMTEVLFRVDKASTALPLFPVAASDDIDIAWQVLLTQVAPAPVAPSEPATDATEGGTGG
ncbi:MAG: hypothetical protein OEO77_11730 [Acidimicrobiia bacterium]|nr:hypothetical protein [Acidimicrobiia bacterium]